MTSSLPPEVITTPTECLQLTCMYSLQKLGICTCLNLKLSHSVLVSLPASLICEHEPSLKYILLAQEAGQIVCLFGSQTRTVFCVWVDENFSISCHSCTFPFFATNLYSTLFPAHSWPGRVVRQLFCGWQQC